MHELLLGRAAQSAPAIVLGLLLKPYSLGHDLLLAESGNPLASKNACDPLYLSRAVLICCQNWAENQRTYKDPLLGIKLAIWRLRTRRVFFKQELATFVKYRDAGCLELPLSGVARPNSGPAPRPSGSPFVLRVQQWLMTTLHFSEAQSWDYPYGLAVMRWQCHWEQDGGLEVYNTNDAEFDQFVAEQEKKGREQLCRV